MLAICSRNDEADVLEVLRAHPDCLLSADRGRSYVVLSDVFVAAGDRDRGRELLERGLDVLVEHGSRFALDAGRRLADLLEAEGDTAGALVALKRATDAAAAQAASVTHG